MKKLMTLMFAMTICFSSANLVRASAQDVNSSKYVLETLASCESSALTTDGLSLYRASDSELEKLAIYYKNAEIGYFLRGNDKELSEQESLASLKKYNSGQNVSFVIKDAKGAIVGEIVLTLLGNNTVNIAYWIVPEFRGNGYAAKACELMIRSLSEKSRDLLFFIGIDKENSSSKRVVDKLQKALCSKSTCYEILKMPFKLKYKISPLDENESNFKLDIFINGKHFSSANHTKEQIESITYKKIFELKEIEFTRFNYFIKFAY